MITGVTKTEANYRAIMMDSSSSLKDFSMDRKKYVKKYLLNEPVEDKDTQAATMGRLVECLLWQPERFDELFYMSSCIGTPTGLMLAFVEALYVATRDATNEQGEVTRTFEDISNDAYRESGFKIKYEAVITKFVGSDAEIYYNEIRMVRSKGLSVITTQDVSNGERIVEELKTNPVTKGILSLVNSQRYTILIQHQVEGYSVEGHLFKSMMDFVVVDHVERTLQIYDLKCVWAVEAFFKEYYLYRRAYIQAYLYYKAGVHMTYTQEEIAGYTVLLPRFIVCDSTNYYNPLIYTLDGRDMNDAYQGFDNNGHKYPGVRSLIKELCWAIDNNTWNISYKNSLSDGVINIKS